MQINRFTTFLFSISLALSLTGDYISSQCHCDLTTLFCDFNCCCDSDCSSVIYFTIRPLAVLARIKIAILIAQIKHSLLH